MALVQVKKFGTRTRHDLEVLHKFGKGVESKNQKVVWANSNVCKS